MKNPLRINTHQIILASNSPRRKELLSTLHIPFEVNVLPNIDESYPESLSPEEVAPFLSEKKAAQYTNLLKSNTLLITADTIVCNTQSVFGKPKDAADAVKILHQLSGNTHRVITGVTLRNLKRTHTFSSITEVTFCKLSGEEIDFYVANFKPFDKAGAYGIQEWIGHIGVESINGSYFNVMGLPIQRLYQELKKYELPA